MHALPNLAHLSVALSLLASASLHAEDPNHPNPPITAAEALKLGFEGLAEKLGQGDYSRDEAAPLYATAKRLEIENMLAAKDLRLVPFVDELRTLLVMCRGHAFDMAYSIMNGGSAYRHGHFWDQAEIENFLAGFAKHASLAKGEGSPKATKLINKALSFLKSVRTAERDTVKADREATAELEAMAIMARRDFLSLRARLATLPADDALELAAFAVGTLSWIDDDWDK